MKMRGRGGKFFSSLSCLQRFKKRREKGMISPFLGFYREEIWVKASGSGEN